MLLPKIFLELRPGLTGLMLLPGSVLAFVCLYFPRAPRYE